MIKKIESMGGVIAPNHNAIDLGKNFTMIQFFIVI